MFNLIPYLSVVENVCLPCGFSARRKSLRNALAIGLGCAAAEAESLLAAAGIEPGRRAQTLTLPAAEVFGPMAQWNPQLASLLSYTDGNRRRND